MDKHQDYKISINVYGFHKGKLVKHDKKAWFGYQHTSIENAKIDAIVEMKKILDIDPSDKFGYDEENENGVVKISYHEVYYGYGFRMEIICHTFIGLDNDDVQFGSSIDFRKVLKWEGLK